MSLRTLFAFPIARLRYGLKDATNLQVSWAPNIRNRVRRSLRQAESKDLSGEHGSASIVPFVGRGRRVMIVKRLNRARPLSNRVTVAGELWSSMNFDPAGAIHQYSSDIAMAYLFTSELQRDVGANFGLNRNTPDIQPCMGLSTRY